MGAGRGGEGERGGGEGGEEEEEEGRRRGLGTGKRGLHYIVVSLRGSKRQQRARSVTNEADARNWLSGHQAALSYPERRVKLTKRNEVPFGDHKWPKWRKLACVRQPRTVRREMLKTKLHERQREKRQTNRQTDRQRQNSSLKTMLQGL